MSHAFENLLPTTSQLSKKIEALPATVVISDVQNANSTSRILAVTPIGGEVVMRYHADAADATDNPAANSDLGYNDIALGDLGMQCFNVPGNATTITLDGSATIVSLKIA